MNWNSFRAFSFMLMVCAVAQAQVPITQVMNIPNTGQQITPLAPRGARFTYMNPALTAYPNYNVGRAVTTVTSPDKKTLAGAHFGRLRRLRCQWYDQSNYHRLGVRL